ncbi:MAG: WD40 repeat [Candidatus Kentron sp. G]|nr:MAG: WD40 repeat [Candidatus Kentron sp. G]VFM95832.1 MAG: WD40 repeat [Candidatus Kentron sp. G]VFM97473.1 MAG: WD40 repeat [Candidatus Kentron sp. G]
MRSTTAMNRQLQDPSPHPALRLRHTLREHSGRIYRMALSPDGRILASPSEDANVRLWEVESGKPLWTPKYKRIAACVAWSPDGTKLVNDDVDKKVSLWESAVEQRILILGKHNGIVKGIAWSPSGEMLASCSDDRTIRIWDPVSGYGLRELTKHTGPVEGIAWSPDGRRLCSGSWDNTVRLWNAESGETLRVFDGHDGPVRSVVWSPNGGFVVSGSDDRTIRIREVETGRERYVLEGHTAAVISIAFMDEARLLASLGTDGRLTVWWTGSWTEAMRVERIGSVDFLSNLAADPTLPILAVRGVSPNEINLWEMDFSLLYGESPDTPTVFYVNAEAVLLGAGGVGKSGLGDRIAGKEFRETESGHGTRFRRLPLEGAPGLASDTRAQLTLWDVAGRPEYRLLHQPSLGNTDAALLLFDCADAGDPFRGVPYWAGVLGKQAPAHAWKPLVSSRSDVSPVIVDQSEIGHALAKYGLDGYFKTSAGTGEGIEELVESLMAAIPWDRLARTSTPRLFQVVREFLLESGETGADMISMETLRQAIGERFPERAAAQAELDTVIGLLQGRGLVYRLTPHPGETWILLKPERIDQYGAAILQAAGHHPAGIGAVSERDVLTGNLPLTGIERLPREQEAVVLEVTAELLLQHNLCFREMGYLVFPGEIGAARPPPAGNHGRAGERAGLAYRFSGAIESLYAALVVRLGHTIYFRREEQWEYATEFSRDGKRLGLGMRQLAEDTGELTVDFESGVGRFDRIGFLRFIADHLRARDIDREEPIPPCCPNCGKEVTDREAIEERRGRKGRPDIPCQFCNTTIVIAEFLEEQYRRDPALDAKQQQLASTVERQSAKEIRQFRADRRKYSAAGDGPVHILHLSDLHLEDEKFADICRARLETDLVEELRIERLSYLVISGDITGHATEAEYRIAFAMVDSLVKRFGLDAGRVVVVPGNHDIDWELSEAAYPFVLRRKLPKELPADRHIPAGEAGALVRDDERYRERLANFDTHFYRRVCRGEDYYPRSQASPSTTGGNSLISTKDIIERISGARDYPPDGAGRFLWVEHPRERILFLGLDSCWRIDHHFRDRASIDPSALRAALDRIQDGPRNSNAKYDDWLKIAVFHHPVTGKEAMNGQFMELLATNGFQLCLHGHIHEDMASFHKYDNTHVVKIVGAGTFGAPTRTPASDIPLRYNLLTFDPETREMTVNIRKKEKPDGPWSADTRWGDKNTPTPWYRFPVFS